MSNDHRPLPQLHYPLGQGHIQRYKRSQIRSDIQISFYKKNWGTSIFHHPPRTVDLNCTEHLGRGASPAILNMISYDYLNTDLTFLLTFGNPPLTQLHWLLGWGQIRYFWSYLIFYIYSTKTLYIFRILCRAWLLWSKNCIDWSDFAYFLLQIAANLLQGMGGRGDSRQGSDPRAAALVTLGINIGNKNLRSLPRLRASYPLKCTQNFVWLKKVS